MRNLLLVALSILLSGQLKATCGDEEVIGHVTYKLYNGFYLERNTDRIVYSSRKSFHLEDFSFMTKGEYVSGQNLRFTIQSSKDGAIARTDLELSFGMSVPEFREAVNTICSNTIIQVSNNDKNEWTSFNLLSVAKFLEWLNWGGNKEN